MDINHSRPKTMKMNHSQLKTRKMKKFAIPDAEKVRTTAPPLYSDSIIPSTLR